VGRAFTTQRDGLTHRIQLKGTTYAINAWSRRSPACSFSTLEILRACLFSPPLYVPLHTCNSLRPAHIGQTVTLAGWVNTRRDHGGVIFIDLRDREGLTQVVFRPEEHPQVSEASHGLRSEDVLKITGTVAARLPVRRTHAWPRARSR